MRVVQAISLLSFISAAVAAPTKADRRSARLARRAAGLQHNRPIAPNTQNLADIIEIETNTTHAQYSSNWAGAVVISSGITSVTGTFTVPSDKSDSGSGASASAWVGIDGDTCGAGLLLRFVFWGFYSNANCQQRSCKPESTSLTVEERRPTMHGTSGTLTTPTTSVASRSPPETA